MFLSITGVTQDNKLAKFLEFNIEADAIVHAEKHNGFVFNDIGGNRKFWVVDLVAKTITQDVVAEAEAVEFFNNNKYKDDRRSELSLLDGEGMDAIRKEIVALRTGLPETAEYAEYMVKVISIKDKYPKPV